MLRSGIWVCMLGLTLASCSTVPDPYIPTEVGAIDSSQAVRGLELSIEPTEDQIAFKNPVTFRVVIKNKGDTAYWLPRSPYILFYWVYPTGQRDQYVRDIPTREHLRRSGLVQLPPGHQLVYLEHIETFYFPREGVTEFRAAYISPRNLNSTISPFWSGQLLSNSYGVRLF